MHLRLKIRSSPIQIHYFGKGLLDLNYNPKDTTWEYEEAMWADYPYLFAYFEEI